MDRRRDEEDNNVAAVYEASLNGCVSTLNTLIQRDAMLLHKISLTSFAETPLHIAALLGHVEFTGALLSKKPNLANEVDSQGRTPLHLASAEGHTEIVKALLRQTNAEICLVCDEDGRIPLHLAAMRGRMEVIKELLFAKPQSIRVELDGCNVLHLCVRYNHLDALKLLVESSINDQDDFLTSKDSDGNSILHLATMFKQTKTIKYLLSISEIKREVNATNRMGYTALDVLEFSPRDFKYLRIQDIFKEAGARRCTNLMISTSSSLGPTVRADAEEQTAQNTINEAVQAAQSSRFKKWWRYLRSWSWVKYLKHQGNWIEETRGTLMVVATVIATMTFQAGITPPGGVWQENTTTGGSNCSEPVCEAGTAVLSYAWPLDYIRNKFAIWFLTLAMTTAVTFMALTYLWAVGLATPDHLLRKVYRMAYSSAGTWIGLLVIVGVVNTIRLFYWIMKKLRKSTRRSNTVGPIDHDIVNV
ncbi:ankyrin repeat and SAM domain-containing protein 1A-like isoform X2 [Juglans microcarpa x Juglans regia]|uniref:ankyrin repeat and SAM domain-containing protein 1A-like isoform X2 n=1 Tax=Juglans microcarpa x Juglans regia TaxID=2249226 RepID=UPI001B7E9943|nr:ankyrin repeat and SAM domain-containing protein 1A-like isoform X2 [Juglans microcarpa x Juglans regia]